MSVKKVREEDSQGHVIYKETSSDMVVREDGTTVEDGLKEAEAPTFDDSGTVSGINSFQTFYQSIVSKMPFINFLRNFKAGLNFIVNTGQIVNNGTTNQAGFVLDARYGKNLQDQITELNSKSQVIYLEEAISDADDTPSIICHANGNTLHTPFKEGSTAGQDILIISVHAGAYYTFNQQLALIAGDSPSFFARGKNPIVGWSKWSSFHPASDS